MKYCFEKSGGLGGSEIDGGLEIQGAGEKLKFSGADFGFALMMIVCGFLYWNLINIQYMGLGVFLFWAVLIVSVLGYFRVKKIRQTGRSMLWLAVSAASAVQFVLFDEKLKPLNLVFLSLSFIYWVVVSSGNSMEQRLSVYTVWDFIRHTFGVPFSNFSCEYHGIKYGLSKNKHGGNVKYAILGFALFLPLMVFVVALLISADAAFEAAMSTMFGEISGVKLLTYAVQFAFGIPVACYLYGLVYGNVHGIGVARGDKEKAAAVLRGVSISPKITVYTVLTAFNLIYIVFFAVQMTYFLSAFQNVLPADFTYAEYARRGFFEFFQIASVNMVLLTLSQVFIKKEADWKEPKMLRIQTALMSLLTIGLIATALSKMYMYIKTYGLTELRVYTSWFMIMLALCFGVIFLRQMRKFNASRILIVGGILGFLLLAFGNVDGNIAKYNLAKYESGQLERIDYQVLFSLSDGAAPYIYEHYPKIEDEKIKGSAYNYLVYGVNTYGQEPYPQEYLMERNLDLHTYITTFNLQSYRAEKIKEAVMSR